MNPKPVVNRAERVERAALWSILVVLVVYVGAMTAIVTGELNQINAVLLMLVADDRAQTTPASSQPITVPKLQAAQVGIAGVKAISDTLAMTVTVRMSGPGDLLFEPPVLQAGGRSYPVTGASLEKARFAFLDLVTKGAATTHLVFEGAPTDTDLMLVFNPSREPDDVIAPQVRAAVPKAVK